MSEVDATTAQVGVLAERWQLPARATTGLIALVELVARDNRAPTTVRDPRRALDDHLADSLVSLELAVVRGARRVADVGSGAGFPGLPLALALPDAEVFLVESNARKCEFLAAAVEASGAANATVVRARAEEWRDGIGQHDLVTARAVGALHVVAEYAAPLLRIGGALVAWRGRRDQAAEEIAAASAYELGLELAEPCQVFPYPLAQQRYLHPMLKVADTPARFPRRPGMAIKRSLGAGREQTAAIQRRNVPATIRPTG